MFSRLCIGPTVRLFLATLIASSVVAVIVLVSPLAQVAADCTVFALKASNSLVYGRNMDYEYEHGLILVNKRHVSKTAFIPAAMKDVTPVQWISQYGSVTVSNVGREFPDTGMNEVGLVVCETTLEESRYPAIGDKGAINIAQWIQYQLDRYATLNEVLANIDEVRIFPPGKRGHHYFMCDASGECATLEYLDGHAVVHRGNILPVTALTNDTYEASIAFLTRHIGFGGAASVPQDQSSLSRFVRTADMLRSRQANAHPVDYAFQILREVAQGDTTKRSIVFDIVAKRLYFRTNSHPAIKVVNLANLDYGCESPMRMLDTNQSGQGDLSDKLELYTDQAHANFMRTVLNDNVELRQIVGDMDAFVDQATHYYATFQCQSDTVRQPGSGS